MTFTQTVALFFPVIAVVVAGLTGWVALRFIAPRPCPKRIEKPEQAYTAADAALMADLKNGLDVQIVDTPAGAFNHQNPPTGVLLRNILKNIERQAGAAERAVEKIFPPAAGKV